MKNIKYLFIILIASSLIFISCKKSYTKKDPTATKPGSTDSNDKKSADNAIEPPASMVKLFTGKWCGSVINKNSIKSIGKISYVFKKKQSCKDTDKVVLEIKKFNKCVENKCDVPISECSLSINETKEEISALFVNLDPDKKLYYEIVITLKDNLYYYGAIKETKDEIQGDWNNHKK